MEMEGMDDEMGLEGSSTKICTEWFRGDPPEGRLVVKPSRHQPCLFASLRNMGYLLLHALHLQHTPMPL